jgi:predicted nucleic acid-binding protein
MTDRCFVDANVLVYALDPRDARKRQRAGEWLDLLWRERTARTSMQVLSEAYNALTRRMRVAPHLAWEELDRYFVWQPQPVDEAVLRRAREVEHAHRLSWWDSMIVASAQLQRCAVLLTEDLHDGARFGSLCVRDPFLHEVREREPVYGATPAAKSLHRPRGRPRRAVPA